MKKDGIKQMADRIRQGLVIVKFNLIVDGFEFFLLSLYFRKGIDAICMTEKDY